MPTLQNRVQIKSPKTKRQWLEHQKKWEECKLCPLGESAVKHVLLRGKLPCSVLFIGEAPGVSEDVTGVPFIGQAGTVFDKLLALTVVRLAKPFSYAVTNALACIPRTSTGDGFREPVPIEIAACHPRVLDIIKIAEPQLIVNLGKIAGKSTKLPDSIKWAKRPPVIVGLYHPSYVMREGGPASVAGKRFVLELEQAITNHLSSPEKVR